VAINDEVRTVAHAAERLARIIVAAIESPEDLRTLTQWGRYVGLSGSTVKSWCAAAGERPKHALDLMRLLRAKHQLERNQSLTLLEVLDIVDRRTAARLLRRAGFADEHELSRFSTADLIRHFLPPSHVSTADALLKHLSSVSNSTRA
jgi:hypothetical protein